MCRRAEYQIGYKWRKLALMAIGALLGVKILRRNAEHVVTLNANTMKNGLPRRRRFVFRGVGLGLSGFGCHTEILAYWRASQHFCVCSVPAASWSKGTASYGTQSEPIKPLAVRLPPETLLECQFLIPPVKSGRARTE
jgi:hypothetical protein